MNKNKKKVVFQILCKINARFSKKQKSEKFSKKYIKIFFHYLKITMLFKIKKCKEWLLNKNIVIFFATQTCIRFN